MATKNDSKTIEINEEENAVACSKSGLIESSGLGKSAKQVQNKKTSAVGKNSASYWASRIYKPAYKCEKPSSWRNFFPPQRFFCFALALHFFRARSIR